MKQYTFAPQFKTNFKKMRMKTSLISMVIGFLLFIPTSVLAEPRDDWGNGVPHKSLIVKEL